MADNQTSHSSVYSRVSHQQLLKTGHQLSNGLLGLGEVKRDLQPGCQETQSSENNIRELLQQTGTSVCVFKISILFHILEV